MNCQQCQHVAGKTIATEYSSHVQYGCRLHKKPFTDKDGELGWGNREKWKRCDKYKDRIHA